MAAGSSALTAARTAAPLATCLVSYPTLSRSSPAKDRKDPAIHDYEPGSASPKLLWIALWTARSPRAGTCGLPGGEAHGGTDPLLHVSRASGWVSLKSA